MSSAVEMPTDEKPITPNARARRKNLDGWPITDAFGNTWQLAWLNADPAWDKHRDTYYDEITLRDRLIRSQAEPVVYAALHRNYDLSGPELAALLTMFSTPELTEAAFAILVIPQDAGYGFSEWMHATLAINGIDPKNVAPGTIPAILCLLVATGRTIPPEKFCQADIARATIRTMYALAENPQHAAPGQ